MQKKIKTSVTLDPEVMERLDRFANQRKLNRSAALTQLILDAPIKRERKKEDDYNKKTNRII